MPAEKILLLCLWVWFLVLIVVFRVQSRRRTLTVGLSVAYLCNFAINHWFGALIYALPWYSSMDYEFVCLGFLQSTYGFLAFVVGSIWLTPFLNKLFHFPKPTGKQYIPNQQLPILYIVTGAFFYLFLIPILGKIPSIGALAQSGWTLLICGLCLACWKAWYYGKKKGLLRWLALSLLFPIFTTVSMGFLGFGIVVMCTILVFVAAFYRPKWKVAVSAVLAVYLGLSLFNSYAKERGELRSVVWDEDSGISQKIETSLNIVRYFEFFNLWDEEHLERIDLRLNQNILVGKGVEYLVSHRENYAKGKTIVEALLAMIPRVLWPDKPFTAGSGDMVSTYTGETFAEGTAVGVGQVLEFYINFGTAGVIVGFLLLGLLVGVFDAAAADCLFRGNWKGFAFWFLPAQAFMNCGGSLVDVTMTVAASFIFCILVNRFLLPRFSGRVLKSAQGETR